MHIGRSACPVVQTAIESAVLYHKPSKSAYTYTTPVSRFIPYCLWAEDQELDERVQELIRVKISQCEIQSPCGLVLKWERCVGTLSACGTFHYFKGKKRLGDGTTRVIQLYLKVVHYRYRLMDILKKQQDERDPELDTNVVPTRFLVDGKIQIMEYLPGDVATKGLVDEPNTVVRFALWLARVMLVITKKGGVYADLKPENVLRKRNSEDGYCLCDVETIRSSNSIASHASTYPLYRDATDAKGSKALRNMVYAYLVTVYNMWAVYQEEDRARALRRSVLVCKPLQYKELKKWNQHKTFDHGHAYFTKVATHPEKPKMLCEIEERIVAYFEDTERTFHSGTESETIQLFVEMEEYLVAMLEWLETPEDEDEWCVVDADGNIEELDDSQKRLRGSEPDAMSLDLAV